MRTSHPAALAALVATCLATAPRLSAQSGDPSIPVGALSAYPTVVQAGTHPVLTWGIDYPQVAKDILTIQPNGTITAKQDLTLEVRVLGASYQTGTDRYGKPVWGTVDAQIKADGATTWTRFFYSTQDKVIPTQILHTQTVRAGRPIDIRGRCYNGSSWLSYRSTGVTTANVVALVNGEEPPSTVPAFKQQKIEDFLRPYLDSSGKIMIGPKDVIYLIELGQTNTNSSGFDLQDLVVLVTFKTNSNSSQTNYASSVGSGSTGGSTYVPPVGSPSLE